METEGTGVMRLAMAFVGLGGSIGMERLHAGEVPAWDFFFFFFPFLVPAARDVQGAAGQPRK